MSEITVAPLMDPVDKVGVLRNVAKFDKDSGPRGDIDGLEFKDGEHDLARTIKSYAGKKNKNVESSIKKAISFISQNPQGNGSVTVRGLDKGQGTPIYNHKRVQLWRFKPSEANSFPNDPALQKSRIVYSVVELDDGQKALGIVDLINRSDFGKKYH